MLGLLKLHGLLVCHALFDGLFALEGVGVLLVGAVEILARRGVLLLHVFDIHFEQEYFGEDLVQDQEVGEGDILQVVHGVDWVFSLIVCRTDFQVRLKHLLCQFRHLLRGKLAPRSTSGIRGLLLCYPLLIGRVNCRMLGCAKVWHIDEVEIAMVQDKGIATGLDTALRILVQLAHEVLTAGALRSIQLLLGLLVLHRPLFRARDDCEELAVRGETWARRLINFLLISGHSWKRACLLSLALFLKVYVTV